MTNEERYGIMKQPEATCPMIDKNLELIKRCGQSLQGYKKFSLEEVEDAFFNISYELDKIDLENVRKNVEAIREWGEQWKRLALDSIFEKEHFETLYKEVEK